MGGSWYFVIKLLSFTHSIIHMITTFLLIHALVYLHAFLLAGVSPNEKYDPTYAYHIDHYYRRNEVRHVAHDNSIHIFGPGKVQTELSNNMR